MPGAGLCESCHHARPIVNDRGSRFLLCQLALTDSAFRKYPRLPVLSCRGYVQADITGSGDLSARNP